MQASAIGADIGTATHLGGSAGYYAVYHFLGVRIRFVFLYVFGFILSENIGKFYGLVYTKSAKPSSKGWLPASSGSVRTCKYIMVVFIDVCPISLLI